MKYSKSQLQKWDEYATLQYAKDESFREGYKESFREGYKEGFKEGFKEGYKKGREEAQIKIIKKLILAGEKTVSEIADFVEVPEAFVEKIKASMPNPGI
ncbi:Yae1 family protein [Flavitalea flava]